MSKLYISTYNDISAYLMDFGFGGFLGYGGVCPGNCLGEELKIGMKDDVDSQ